MSCKNDITGGATPASFEPSIDYVVVKIPRFTFEKFPAANDRLTTQMKSVGEVMAIGRTFQESLHKALRGLETGLDGLAPQLSLPLSEEDSDRLAHELRAPGANRLLYVADALRAGWTLARVHELTRIDPWFLAQVEDLVREEAQVRARGPGRAGRRAAARPEAQGLLRQPPGRPGRHAREGDPRQAPRAQGRAGLQARRHLRRRIRHFHRLPVLDLRGGVRGEADHAAQDHDPGRRPEPHRPGHRVRLLLRARGAAAARGRLRDHHGQLQPRDRLDRLRHLRPAVLRAPDARGRARDPRRSRSPKG